MARSTPAQARPLGPNKASQDGPVRPRRGRASAQRKASSPRRKRPVDAHLDKRIRLLAERVKELRCLYRISHLLEGGPSSLDRVLEQVANVLPTAWLHPESACARISARGHSYQSANFRPTRWSQRAGLLVAGKEAGFVEVCYLRRFPDHDEGPFLAEERSLLDAIAERISDHLELEQAERQLRAYQGKLRALASQLTSAEERERRRIAVRLHDHVGQPLAIAKLKLETVMASSPEPVRAALAGIRDHIGEAMANTRSLTFEISPPILYELGLGAALEWLAERAAACGLQVSVACRGDDRRLPDEIRGLFFQGARELLTNVVKHAHTRRAGVIFECGETEARLEVSDEGEGFDSAARGAPNGVRNGFGLFSIGERLKHLGGFLAIESAPGAGTRATLAVKLGPLASGEDAP